MIVETEVEIEETEEIEEEGEADEVEEEETIVDLDNKEKVAKKQFTLIRKQEKHLKIKN